MTTPTFASSVDLDQMTSEEPISSGTTLFVNEFANLNEYIISNNFDWFLDEGLAKLVYSAG